MERVSWWPAVVRGSRPVTSLFFCTRQRRFAQQQQRPPYGFPWATAAQSPHCWICLRTMIHAAMSVPQTALAKACDKLQRMPLSPLHLARSPPQNTAASSGTLMCVPDHHIAVFTFTCCRSSDSVGTAL